jgi:hypothetical protein
LRDKHIAYFRNRAKKKEIIADKIAKVELLKRILMEALLKSVRLRYLFPTWVRVVLSLRRSWKWSRLLVVNW